MGPIGIDQGVRSGDRRIDELSVFEALAIQPRADKLGGLTYLPSKGGVSADARNPKEPEEVIHFPYNGIFL